MVFIFVSKNEVHENESTKKIDKILELSLLFDFYGELLKENKKQVFEDYISNDLSLGEIATERGISRQGVYDIVEEIEQISNDILQNF